MIASLSSSRGQFLYYPLPHHLPRAARALETVWRDLWAVPGRSSLWPGLCWRATRGTEAGGARSSGACPPHFKPGTPALVHKRFLDSHLLRDDGSHVARELAASLIRRPAVTPGGWQRPSIRGRSLCSGTPENGFAAKRSVEAWRRGNPSDRRHGNVPAAGTVPRTSPRSDVVVVSRVSWSVDGFRHLCLSYVTVTY